MKPILPFDQSITQLALADVGVQVRLCDISDPAKRNISSALNTVDRVLGQPLAMLPGRPVALLPLIETAKPDAAGIGPTRWGNVRADLNRALRLCGLIDLTPHNTPIENNWRAAIGACIPAKRYMLKRFARFCSGQGIDAAAVTDATLAAFREDLMSHRLSKVPERTVKDLLFLWLQLRTDRPDLGMPALTITSAKSTCTLGWSDLPAALAADAADFKANSLAPDWFEDEGDRAPVRPATADQRDRMLRRLASAELLAGVPSSALNTLADVIDPRNLRRGLTLMIERNSDKPSRQVFEMALLAQTLGRHWCKLAETELAVLAQWVRKFRPRKGGMTDKNRERLRQFTNSAVIGSLINLPEQVFAGLAGRPVTATTARLAQRAVVIALLTVTPMRLKNLRLLDRQQHFRPAMSVHANRWHLVLSSSQVKNNVDLEYPVPPHVWLMIEQYMTVYQPLLHKGSSSVLFPGRADRPAMSDTGMRRIIVEFIKLRLGLRMNPHLFRHLGALIFLKANPGQYEAVRQLLGHKNLQTTTEFYTGFETDEAMDRFAGVLDTYRPVPTLHAASSSVG